MNPKASLERIEPEPLNLIQQARDRHDKKAKGFQRLRHYFALATASVGPVAVTLLVAHFLLARPESPLISLVGLECLLLLIALLIGFLGWGGRHKPWIKERLRAELLRREEFLLLARLGPYLSVSDESLPNRVAERLIFIDSAVNDPLDLISMQDDEVTWRHALEDTCAAGKLQTMPGLESIAQRYLKDRIVAQRNWFASKSVTHHNLNERLEAGAKGVLILALVLSLAHLMKVWIGEASPQYPKVFTVLIFFAISLPAFGGMLGSLQSIFGSERLSRSYRYDAEVLEEFERSLRRLQANMTPQSPNRKEAQFRFMRLVLEVEELLAQELRVWWLIVYPNIPKASA